MLVNVHAFKKPGERDLEEFHKDICRILDWGPLKRKEEIRQVIRDIRKESDGDIAGKDIAADDGDDGDDAEEEEEEELDNTVHESIGGGERSHVSKRSRQDRDQVS